MTRSGLLTRRSALLGLGAAWTLAGAGGGASLALAAAPTPRRFVVVILRGALDGMAAVVPYGDPGLAVWRPALLPPGPGAPDGLGDLGGFFGLHPALAGLHAMYAAGEVLPIHAVAGPYRVRSHFEAQDLMESGADHPMTSGWLNRAVGHLAPALRGSSPGGPALALGLDVPLILRGPQTVGTWSPSVLGRPAPDLYARLAALNAADPVTGPAIAEALRERGFAQVVLANAPAPVQGPVQASVQAPVQALAAAPGMAQARPPEPPGAFATLAATAGAMLAAPDGPRVAALEVEGWDTHAAQVARLAPPLRGLDAGLVALKARLGDAWRETVVLVMTEFGRTVRMNGTAGTDHGTGTVAFVLGGAVAGGRVRADWPGLAQARLFEDRDLQPTADLRAVAKGLLAQHLRLSAPALADVFPDSADAPPMPGLLRA